MKTQREHTRTLRLDLLLQEPAATVAATSVSRSPRPGQHADQRTEFDQLLETLYDATILTDHDGQVIMANRRALDFFQTDLPALCKCNIEQLVSGVNKDILATVCANIAARRFTLMQAYCIRSDQSIFPSEISTTAVVRDGQDCVCFSIRDITVRREVEERLRIEGEAIRNSGDGIVITDTEGIITYANPAVARLWDRENPDDLIGETIVILFPHADGIEDAVNAAVTGGAWNGEMEAIKTGAQSLFLQTAITASLNEKACITHLIFSFTDITRRRQDEMALIDYQNHLEDLIRERTNNLTAANQALLKEVEERRKTEGQLQEAVAHLREHDKAKSVFVSNVSHELRTPLTSLIHSLENLMRGVAGTLSAPVTSYLTMMLDDCWRLERTINDILDLSRIENGTLTLVRQPVPFTRLMRRAAESIRFSMESIPLRYHVAGQDLPGFTDCDAPKIERVLLNILSNAMKYTPPDGSCSVLFEKIERKQAPALACTITDSGVGIPPEFIDRVTERFFRVGEHVEGTGLGLAIARELAERHGGGIEIQSPPPDNTKGTLVRIWLPVHPPPNVVIVLPENLTCKAIKAELEMRSYTADCSHSGTEAVQNLRDGQHSIVLIGQELPDISGTETIMHIKADAALRNIRIFFLAEAPLPQSQSGLLQGFQIPILMLNDGPMRTIDSMEENFLPTTTKTMNNHQQRQTRDNTKEEEPP